MSLDSAFEKLELYFDANGIKISEESEAKIVDLEDVINSYLPLDIRKYLQRFCGVIDVNKDEDKNGFMLYDFRWIEIFNSNMKVRKINEHVIEEKNLNVLMFAEYWQFSWIYTFSWDKLDSEKYSISILNGKDGLVELCSCLEDFIELLVSNHEELYYDGIS